MAAVTHSGQAQTELALPKGPLLAQADPAEPDLTRAEAIHTSPTAAPSQNVTINLISRLVQKGVLSKEEASELISMAEADAATARAQAQADAGQIAQAVVAQASGQLAAASPPGAASDEDVRVTYIPEFVKAQMREEIKADVLAQTKEEDWAAPHAVPKWVKGFRVGGDVRIRFEGDYFPEGNDNTGAFPNFNAINTGAPFDVAGTQFSPQLNVDEDRHRFRLRLRIAAEADLGHGFTAGMRIATGENNSPVTTNQTLGLANQGQGGNFSKYAIWLDRGFLKYELAGVPNLDLSVSAGRFDNPFFSTEILWDDDLGFDGAVLKSRFQITKGFSPFLVAGAFPVFNTDFNFSSNQPDKFRSHDKYLYGGQLGGDIKLTKDFSAKFAAAYYYFDNIEGRLSDPYTPLSASDAGNTDNTRPSFAQKGNTYMALRNIVPNSLNNFGTTNQFQYFGLATPFHNVALTGRLDYSRFEPVQISLVGEYIKNLAFDQEAINAKAVNNRGPQQTLGGVGAFEGGDTAWIAGLKVGAAMMQKRGDWQFGVNYRYVESDAVVDGFTDSDFGLGGTNLEGYTISGAVALSPNVYLGVRYMSANEIAGPPLKSDILQVDLSGKF